MSTALRVKLDEPLSESIGNLLQAQGYAPRTVRGQGWGGTKDFGDIRAYPPGTHQGVLVLRPEREGLSEFRRLLAEVLRKHRLESLVGAVTVAVPGRVRIRRKPL